MAREKELSLVSIVAAADKKKEGFSYPLFSVSALESDFGATIEV